MLGLESQQAVCPAYDRVLRLVIEGPSDWCRSVIKRGLTEDVGAEGKEADANSARGCLSRDRGPETGLVSFMS